MTEVELRYDHDVWDDAVLAHRGHPLQLWGWGELKRRHGWQAERLEVLQKGSVIGRAQILVKRLPRPFNALAYVPRGPVCKDSNRQPVLDALAAYAKNAHKAVAITVEPDWEGELALDGWRRSINHVLIARTLVLDLLRPEDELMADMTKKTRQYIRKSSKDVTVRQVKTPQEIDACLELYRQTATRAGFALHGDQYYKDVFEMLGDHSPAFAAFHGEKMVAFLWLAVSSETAFELYGGMDEDGQSLRANYALKWHAIQTMKRWGVGRYDMNGLLNDGVSTFKQGFASHENMLVGTYDKPLSPLYGVWSKGLPLAKRVLKLLKR